MSAFFDEETKEKLWIEGVNRAVLSAVDREKIRRKPRAHNDRRESRTYSDPMIV